MPIRIIDTPRLYRQIADQLRDLICSGELKSGARLPPERDLALQLAVSRPSVREALIALEVEGWVEVRKGAGIYVCDQPRKRRPSADEIGDAPGPLELIRARAIIEGEVAALAAKNPRKAGLADLNGALRQMQEEAEAGQIPLQGDRLFHVRLAEMAGNGVLITVVADLFDHRNGPMSKKLGQHLENRKSWYAAIEEHRQVVVALSRKDPEAARAAMQRHMDRSHRRLSVRLD